MVTLGAPFAPPPCRRGERGQQGQDRHLRPQQGRRPAEGRHARFAVDQQPYLQGYLAIDPLWLYKYNGNFRGGGKPVLTGPQFVTKDDAAEFAEYTKRGTR